MSPAPDRTTVRSGFSAAWTHFIRRLFPAYLIFHLCGTHFPGAKLSGKNTDKWLHTLLYFMISVLFWEFLRTFKPRISLRETVVVAVAVASFAAFDEITQPIFGRGADVFDWVVDLIGIVLALSLMYFVRNTHSDSGAAQINDLTTS
jgi:glycopeptide antibiotics resistance protein